MNELLLYAGLALFAALSVADVALSVKLQELGAVEDNPLLGKHPSARKLIAFGSISTALWMGGALWLAYKGAPAAWIYALLLWGIVLRIIVVSRGYKQYTEKK